jgi:hypothetical protein
MTPERVREIVAGLDIFFKCDMHIPSKTEKLLAEVALVWCDLRERLDRLDIPGWPLTEMGEAAAEELDPERKRPADVVEFMVAEIRRYRADIATLFDRADMAEREIARLRAVDLPKTREMISDEAARRRAKGAK